MTLVGYWPLNETSGSVSDYSFNGNDGELVDGAADNTPDSVNSTTRENSGVAGGNAYEFDVDGYVNVNASTLDSAESLTMMGWIKTDYTDDYSGPFGYESDSDNNTGFLVRRTDTGDLEIQMNGTQYSLTFDDATRAYDDTWHMVTAVWTGKNLQLFIDGDKVAEDTADTDQVHINGDFNIGRYYWIHADDHWGYEGKISEVRIYDRPLTPSEIQYLYNVGNRGLQTTSKKSS